MTEFNELYLVYVMFLRLILFTFVSGIAYLNADEVEHAVGKKAVCPSAAFHVLVIMLISFL